MGRMRQFYRPRTEEQLRIMAWLLERGYSRTDVARVKLLGPDRVRVTMHSGRRLVVVYEEGAVCAREEDSGNAGRKQDGGGRY